MTKTLSLALMFGGQSTEHEVSVVTALQAFENIDKSKYQIIPIYISKTGQMYTNPKFLEIKNYQDIDHLLLTSTVVHLLRRGDQVGFETAGLMRKFITIDLALPLFHGGGGEDGSLQGFFETLKLPYVGFNVLGSSTAMDKVIAKALFKSLDIPVGPYVYFSRLDWQQDPKACLKKVTDQLKLPVFVKPADGGSTIGINQAVDVDELNFNIEVAAIYSDKILVEQAFKNCLEVNCAALGYRQVTSSVCEMPTKTNAALTFEDKYLKGGKNKNQAAGMASLSRQIPAPISAKLTKQLQQTTVKVFRQLEGCGVARIDYFVDPKTDKFWINEINTPPGSLAYYLFEPLGIKYTQLLDILVEAALARTEDQQKTQTTFDSGLLQQMAMTGLAKSQKS